MKKSEGRFWGSGAKGVSVRYADKKGQNLKNPDSKGRKRGLLGALSRDGKGFVSLFNKKRKRSCSHKRGAIISELLVKRDRGSKTVRRRREQHHFLKQLNALLFRKSAQVPHQKNVVQKAEAKEAISIVPFTGEGKILFLVSLFKRPKDAQSEKKKIGKRSCVI